ncbi:MAG: Crp/Fnr family transcriptional regulator [Myxococcales bacterium]|nr:Crp/Fnr family transcriptional regulator [Myxococcales bacterium]
MRGCRLFREFEERELHELMPWCSLVRLNQGEPLWRVGDDTFAFHHIVRGLVELRRMKGAELTLMAFFGPTECPAVSAVLERKRYGADAVVASADLVALSIRAEPLLARMKTDPRIAIAMNHALLAQMRLLHGKVDVMSAGTVAQRLALFFLNLADRFGDEHEDGETVIPFGLSRQQVATYINARVETVIRALSVWRREGLLLTHRDRIVLPHAQALTDSLAA